MSPPEQALARTRLVLWETAQKFDYLYGLMGVEPDRAHEHAWEAMRVTSQAHDELRRLMGTIDPMRLPILPKAVPAPEAGAPSGA